MGGREQNSRPHLRNYLIALRALLHYASEHSDNYSYSVGTLSHRHKYSYEKIRTIRARGESRMHQQPILEPLIHVQLLFYQFLMLESVFYWSVLLEV